MIQKALLTQGTPSTGEEQLVLCAFPSWLVTEFQHLFVFQILMQMSSPGISTIYIHLSIKE